MSDEIRLRLMRDLQRDFPWMTPERAAGVVGSMAIESRNFQTGVQDGGGPGRGWMQWELAGNGGSGRGNQLQNYMRNTGYGYDPRTGQYDYGNYDANYGFFRQEANTPLFSRWLDPLRATSTAAEAARDFTGSSDSGTGYLRPSIPHTERRIGEADATFDLWNNRNSSPAWESLTGYDSGNYVADPNVYNHGLEQIYGPPGSPPLPPPRPDSLQEKSGFGDSFTLANMGFGDLRAGGYDVAGYDAAGHAYDNYGNLLPDTQFGQGVSDAFAQLAKGGGNTGVGLRWNPETGTYTPNNEGLGTDLSDVNRYSDNTLFDIRGGPAESTGGGGLDDIYKQVKLNSGDYAGRYQYGGEIRPQDALFLDHVPGGYVTRDGHQVYSTGYLPGVLGVGDSQDFAGRYTYGGPLDLQDAAWLKANPSGYIGSAPPANPVGSQSGSWTTPPSGTGRDYFVPSSAVLGGAPNGGWMTLGGNGPSPYGAPSSSGGVARGQLTAPTGIPQSNPSGTTQLTVPGGGVNPYVNPYVGSQTSDNLGFTSTGFNPIPVPDVSTNPAAAASTIGGVTPGLGYTDPVVPSFANPLYQTGYASYPAGGFSSGGSNPNTLAAMQGAGLLGGGNFTVNPSAYDILVTPQNSGGY